MHRIAVAAVMLCTLAACADRDRLVVTTVSPAKCFYDSNVNQQRCRHDVAMQGHAASDPRSARHDIDLQRNPLGLMDVLADGGQQSQRPPGYVYGYDARFEAGYRTPERFDTTIYEGTALATPPSVVPLPATRRPVRKPVRKPVYKD